MNRFPIQNKALLLLLIYLFSINPSVLFHHHKSDIISFEKASPCEKAIYYSSKNGQCTHKSHISKSMEKKCALCDNHTLSAHSFHSFLTKGITGEFNKYYLISSSKYYFQIPSNLLNRGPPAISSYSV